MPYKSKAQMRLFFAKENAGELPKGTARRWAHETKDMKKLPDHVKHAAKPALFEKLRNQFRKNVMKPKTLGASMPKLATVLGTLGGPAGTAAVAAAKVGYQGFKTLGKQKPLTSPLMKTGSVGVAVAAGFTKGAALRVGNDPSIANRLANKPLRNALAVDQQAVRASRPIRSPKAAQPWHKGINWKHMAIAGGIGAAGGWMLRGRDDN